MFSSIAHKVHYMSAPLAVIGLSMLNHQTLKCEKYSEIKQWKVADENKITKANGKYVSTDSQLSYSSYNDGYYQKCKDIYSEREITKRFGTDSKYLCRVKCTPTEYNGISCKICRLLSCLI